MDNDQDGNGGGESGEGVAGGEVASAFALQASLRDASAGNMSQRRRAQQRLGVAAMAMLAKVASTYEHVAEAGVK